MSEKSDKESQESDESTRGNISDLDYSIFIPSLAILLGMIVALIFFPETSGSIISGAFRIVTRKFGWLYVLADAIALLFILYLAVSKYGEITLGGDQPRYSTLSWFAMLFSAAYGSGLVFFGVAGPMYHYYAPPAFGPPAKTMASAIWGCKIGFFHNALNVWALYTIFGIAMGHFAYNRNKPFLLSSLLPIERIDSDSLRSAASKIIDLLAVFITVGGIITTAGLIIIQIAEGINFAYDIPMNAMLIIGTGAILVSAYVIMVSTPVRKGMKYVSNTNIALMVGVMVFTFLAGPTLFEIEMTSTAFGNYLIDLIPRTFYLDPFNVGQGWLAAWTIFFWAWWFSWAIFVGIFIARISEGRSIRTIVGGCLIAPSIIAILWYGFFGSSAIYFDINNLAPIAEMMQSQGLKIATIAMLDQLPLSFIVIPALIVLIATFFITSADSATRVITSFSSGGMEKPPRSLKVTWAAIIGASAVLLYQVGNINALRTAAIVTTLPLTVLIVITIKYLHSDLRKIYNE